MSGVTWPNGAAGALSLSFDNLGEAAEVELGALAPDAPLGGHFTAKRVLPRLLDALGERDLSATFFVEGLNVELYPDELREIAARGHEVGYHAWRHERWAGLSGEEQADNLARGVAAFGGLGIDLTGFRPPGGGLGPSETTTQAPDACPAATTVLREAGLGYCSPAGAGVGIADGIAMLPFEWRHVDASCVLPPFAAVRERMTGSPDPLDPAAFLAFLLEELDGLIVKGGHIALVLHLFMLEWLGWERLGALLDRIVGHSRSGKLWAVRCDQVAGHVRAHPDAFAEETILDPTSWTRL